MNPPVGGHRSRGGKHILFTLLIVLLLMAPIYPLRIPQVYAANWLSGWAKRVKLTIDHNDVTSAVTDFPVLVYLSTASGRGTPQDDLSCVFNEIQSDANRKKIAVTTSDGVAQCYVEIERWDTTNKKAWLWTKVPSVSSTADTDLYLYYDKNHADNTAYVGDTDSTPAQSVWNANYLAVFHMSQVPTGTVYDSTGNNKDLTPNNLDAADQVDAKIGKGINFDSSDTEYLKSGTNTITIQAFTYELWNDPQTIPSAWEVMMNFDTGGVNFRYFAHDNTGSLRSLGYDGEGGLLGFGSGYVTENEWQYFCLTYDGTYMRAYRNSVQYGSSESVTIQQRTDDFEIASYNLGAEKHDGVMDEVRISNIRRDGAWLKASYESERDHLIDYGSEESLATSWLSGWAKRVKLTIDHTDFTSDLINFPVLVYLSTASGRGTPQDDLSCVFNEIQSDANRKKIAVTTGDGVAQCYVEIERWTTASTKAWLWVNVPSVSSTVDTILYLYYDKNQADNTAYVGDTNSAQAQSVWDSNFKGVFHLAETSGGSGAIKNSTSTSNGGTDYGSPTFGATGKIDSAINFDGTDDYINLGKAFRTITSAITIEGWVKTDVVEDSWWFNIGQDDASFKGAIVGGYSSGKVCFGTGNGASPYNTLISSGSYSTSLIYVAATWNGTLKKIFLNGAQDANTASFSGTLSYYNAFTGIGVGYATGGYFDGIIDEVRISNTARSPAWIAASYESERDHLIDYGSEESLTLLTFNSKYVITSMTAVQTSSTSLQDDTQAIQAFSLTASQTVLVIYQANSLSGATMPFEGMQNAIRVDGTDYANSWDSPFEVDSFNARNAVFWIGTLAAGSHTIKGRFASNSSSHAATVSNRILLIYILNGNAFYYLDSSTTQTTSSTSLQDDSSASFTFTPPGNCKALILYNVANSGASEDAYGKKVAINIGGTDYSQAEKSAAADDCPDSIFTTWALSLSVSSTTVKGRFACNRAGYSVTIKRRQLGVLLFADDTLLDTVSSNSQVSTTSSTLVHDDYATITRTTSDARELLVVAMGTKRNDTLDSKWGECYGIMLDGIDRANSRGSCSYTHSIDGLSPGSAATAFAIYMSAGGHTIRGRFSNNYAGETAKIDSRRIVALWLSTTAAPQAANNFAFADGGSMSVGTGVTTIATLSTTSFDSGNNFVIAVVQFQSTSSTSIAAGNLKLARGGTILMSNQYILPISSSNPHNQKWYALMALDSSAPANPTYFVNATAAATGISGEAKMLAISGLTGAMDQGSSILINGPSWPASTTLASLSTGLPAGDNVVLAIVESINDGDSAAQSISICRLYHKLGSMMTDAQYYMTHDQMANVGRWHAHLMPYLDIGASANAIYNVTCTASKANVIHGRATIVAFGKGSLSAAYIDGASTSIGTSETIINKLSTSFQSGSDVAVIASEQFWNMDGSNSNSINANLNKLQQDNSSSGQATNQYAITTSLYGSPDNGKGFGLLDRFTSSASSQYEVKATKSSSYSYMGESKILALSKPPKVPEFPLGPALVLAICSPIFLVIRRRGWARHRPHSLPVVKAGWYSGYGYRKSHTITGSTAGAQTIYTTWRRQHMGGRSV